MPKHYTTCPTCDELLLIADPGFPVHPSCEPPYRLSLEFQLREAAARGDFKTFDELAPIVDAPRKTSLPKSALLYAQWSWPVFPLRAGQKIPATRHGFKDATTDAATITAWWTQNPDYNIGIATGHHFDVIDIDAPKHAGATSGYLSLAHLEDNGAIPDIHGRAITASSGLHLLVMPTGEGNRAGLMPGVDYRGAGGYIVAAPSLVDGNRYEWLLTPSPAVKAGGASKYPWLGAA